MTFLLQKWTLCDAVCSLGPGEQCPDPSPQDLSLQERPPLGLSADSFPHKKLPPKHPWPSLLGHGLTTMNHFLCLIVLFIAFSRVGGLEPQPLIYKVIGDKKYSKERKMALLALRGLHCRARGNSPLALYGYVGEAHHRQWEAQHGIRSQEFKSSAFPLCHETYGKHEDLSPVLGILVKMPGVRPHLVSPALGRWSQKNPQSSPGSPSKLIIKLWASERPCLKECGQCSWG